MTGGRRAGERAPTHSSSGACAACRALQGAPSVGQVKSETVEDVCVQRRRRCVSLHTLLVVVQILCTLRGR